MGKKKKVDLGRLVTARTYSEMKGVDVRTVQYWMNKGKVPTEFVDGVQFVLLPDER